MAITVDQIRELYPDLVDFTNGLLKIRDEVRSFYETVYVACSPHYSPDAVASCYNNEDDAFATALLPSILKTFPPTQQVPCKLAMCIPNKYGFDSALVVGPEWHGYFKGLLDGFRNNLLMVVPCHACEFTGDESIDDFRQMWLRLIPREWDRVPTPKIAVSISNPKTGVVTPGSSRTLLRPVDLQVEIDALNGVVGGSILVINWKRQSCEIHSPTINLYNLSFSSGSITTNKTEVGNRMMEFLSRGEFTP